MIQVACPSCRGPLTAPEDLAGTVVQCPRCQCQMVLPKGPSTAPPPPPSTPAAPVPAPANSYAMPPSAPATATKSAPSGTAQMRPVYAKTPAAEPPAQPMGLPPAPPQQDPSKSTAELTARFALKTATGAPESITTDTLPALHLAETLKAKKSSDGASAARGPLMIIALLVSMGFSLVILFWNPEPPGPATNTQRDAWQQVEVLYFGDGANPKPYQRLLRQAQQAHNKGDRAQMATLLRRVLDMLHAEQPNPEFGVTGYQTPQPPNDEHLEEQITILLRSP